MLAIAMLLQAAAAPSTGGACIPSIAETRRQPAIAGVSLKSVFVTCGELAVNLGKAVSYQSSTNAALRSIVVVLSEPARTRVDLVSLTSDNRLLVQDISQDLAKAAGRGLGATLQEGAVDIASFSAEAKVAVTRADGIKDRTTGLSRTSAKGASSGTLDLTAYLSGVPSQPAAAH